MRRAFFLCLLLSLSMPVHAQQVQRYVIFENGDSPTILLDTLEGTTWRNIYCNSENPAKQSGPLGCWQMMPTSNDADPYTVNEMLKKLRKSPEAPPVKK